MKEYQPGDTFKTQMLEFIADDDRGEGCDLCIGGLKTSICDMLPTGCGNSRIVWKPSNESANMLAVLIKLDGI